MANTVKVKRGNVILNIDEKDVSYYVGVGYNVIDENGNVLRASMPKDVPTLQKYYREHLKKISELEATVAKLTSELSAKKSTKTSSKKSEE